VKNKKQFKLDCFGFLGIVLLLSGVVSGIVVYYAIIEIIK